MGSQLSFESGKSFERGIFSPSYKNLNMATVRSVTFKTSTCNEQSIC
jgi:hypothetical protein